MRPGRGAGTHDTFNVARRFRRPCRGELFYLDVLPGAAPSSLAFAHSFGSTPG